MNIHWQVFTWAFAWLLVGVIARFIYDSYSRKALRDKFAAAALTGLIINTNTISVHSPITHRAYELADAMMVTRDFEIRNNR